MSSSIDHSPQSRANTGDRLIDALVAQQADQPDKPQYVVGSSTNDRLRFVGVDRVSTNDQPGGMECGRTLTGRRYMVTIPHDIVPWLVGSLGAYLSDDEWDQACDEREDEIERRGGAA